MTVVYRLVPAEYSRYCQHLKKLDTDSRYLRFGYAIKDVMIDQVCERIYQNPLKHKIFVIEDEDCAVIAAAHISLEDDPVELAFSVLKDHQSQGLGSALMSRAVEWCQNRGIEHGCMMCLAHNAAIKKLASNHGILVTRDGETLADIAIPKINAGSIVHEVVEDNLAMMDHLGKAQRKFARMLSFPLRF